MPVKRTHIENVAASEGGESAPRTPSESASPSPPLVVDPKAIAALPLAFCRKHHIAPIRLENGVLHLALAHGTSLMVLDSVRALTEHELRHEYRDGLAIDTFLDQVAGDHEQIDSFAAAAEDATGDELASGQADDQEDEGVDDHAIVRLVNVVVHEAYLRDASDIHIHPNSHEVRIRLRVDGVLHTYQTVGRNVLPSIVARIKVLANLDIAKTRMPQDGRMSRTIGGERVDLRVSTLPTVEGEKVVMRLLKNEGQLLKIPDLGFRDSVRHRFMRTVDKPYGMFLVTGPTGSGKSFTLFSVLDYLNDPNINICTVEDPVEYRLPGLAQVQTNPKAGVTFASALRSFLRQDPDVIMVGEIRDQETAKIATEAALTGHLVLATLHTNDAAGAVTRLVEMGVEPFNLTASLLGVLGQRLVRRVCRVCGTPTEPNPDALERLGIEPPAEHSYRAGPGCDACSNSGYRGRTAVHELLVHTPEIESAIMGGVSTDQIARIATDQGMDTLRADATRKAFDGVTTLDEVLRVTDA